MPQAYLIAIASAALYGAADFAGGLTTRRLGTVAAVLVSQFAGLLLLGALLPILPHGTLAMPDLYWSVAAGLAGSAGVALLYRALAVGVMAVVAPTTAVCAVAIPVLAGLLAGEHLTRRAGAGIALALVAIVLVSRSAGPNRSQDRSRDRNRGWLINRRLAPGIPVALLSGVAIGLFFLALARTGRHAGFWPLFVARVVSVLAFGAIALVVKTPLRMSAGMASLAIAAGALDMFANALYLLATRDGALSMVVTLASLYPASTVVLAWVVLGERLRPAQAAGVVCALGAVVLIVGT